MHVPFDTSRYAALLIDLEKSKAALRKATKVEIQVCTTKPMLLYRSNSCIGVGAVAVMLSKSCEQ